MTARLHPVERCRWAALALLAFAALAFALVAGPATRQAGAQSATPTTFRFETPWSYVMEDGGTLCIKIIREGDTSTAQTVYVSGFWYGVADFYAPPSSLSVTFAPGQTERSVDWPGSTGTCLAVANNTAADLEPIRSYRLNLSVSEATNARVPLTGAHHTVSVIDDDATATDYRVGVNGYPAGYVREGSGVSFAVPVLRAGPMDADVQVSCSGAGSPPQYAVPGTDYTVRAPSVTFLGAERYALCQIDVINDSVEEATERVSISVRIEGYVSGWPAFWFSAYVDIIDDDNHGTVHFSSASGTFDEHAGEVRVPVWRSGGSAGSAHVTCRLTTLGSATAARDFTFADQVLTWEDGDDSPRECRLSIIDDAEVEGPETVILELADATGAPIGSPSTFTLTIGDNDSYGQFSVSGTGVSEAAGTGSVTVYWSGNAGPVGVTCRVKSGAGTATPTDDFTLAEQTLTWNTGDTAWQQCSFTVVDDALVEGNETFVIELVNPTGGAALSSWSGEATVTIYDNDSHGQFSVYGTTVWENSGTGSVSVYWSGNVGPVSVTCRVKSGAGTATPTDDFTLAEQTLTWNTGDTAWQQCSFTVVDDALVEGNETFVIELVNPTGGATVSTSNGEATVTIDDNDTHGQFSVYGTTVWENSGTGSVSVYWSGNVGPVSVTCRVKSGAGTATPTADFTLAEQTLTWDTGVSGPKPCSFSVVDDTTVEGEETFVVELVYPSGGAVVSTSSSEATVTIRDNDVPGSLSFDWGYAREGTNTARVRVNRLGGAVGEVTVQCRVATPGGTATQGSDYTFPDPPPTLSWADGDVSEKYCEFTVIDDDEREPNETVILELFNPTGDAVLGTPSTVTVTIEDNDHFPVVTSVSPNTGPITGGTPITIRGRNFGPGTVRVTLLGEECTNLVRVNDGELTCTTPARLGGPAAPYGPVSVQVTVQPAPYNYLNSDTAGTADDFLYYGPGPAVTSLTPSSTTCDGQHWFVLRGTRIARYPHDAAASLTVRVGTTQASFEPLALSWGEGSLLVLAPSLPAGTYRVAVTTIEGTSADVPADDLVCAAPASPPPASSTPAPITAAPAVSGIVPSSGICDGSLQVAILGSAFTSGATVTFGGAAATVTYINANTLVIRPAARAPGQVDIRVTTANGTSPNTPADDFTCLAPPSPPPSGGTGGTGGTGTGGTGTGGTGTGGTGTGGTGTGGTGTGGTGTGGTGTGGTGSSTVAPGPVTYTLYTTYTLIAWAGPDNASIAALLAANPTIRARISAIWTFDPAAQRWRGYFPGAENVPGANDFTTLRTGVSYFIAIRPGPSPVSWLVNP